MIRMVQSSSAGHAKAYFSDALSKADYYIDDQELSGQFHGKVAARLGLQGQATKEAFHGLCENINPATGEKLTQRIKQERTVGYDINFHCPKSVSVLHVLAQDDHILEAFKSSVKETMHDIEADAKARVRKGGKKEDRDTGELIWADFVHQTARPVEGFVPDPHLHSHCFVFNLTWDQAEQQFKAGQFRDVKRDMPYYQAMFHKRLSDKLEDLGYQVYRTDKSFEVKGVPQKVIDLFSKRTDEIGRLAKEKGITDAKELDGLGARTRAKKQKGSTMSELKAEWKSQIHALGQDKDENETVRFAMEQGKPDMTAKQYVDHAVLHSFERASVMAERRILESAYRQGIGNNSVSVDGISEQFRKDERIIQVKDSGRMLCTTKEVLAEEKHMVKLAKEGQGKMIPLYADAPDLKLKDQQAEAVKHVLTTSHRVSIIRGAAGTGKTTLMTEAVKWIEKVGKTVTVIAPSAQASRGVLRGEGFDKAETVAKLLVDKDMQEKLKNQVLWVDEAGLLGTKDMTALLDLTARNNARLILGGDTRQHASVVRGDALRILNTVAGIRTAEVSKIYRQRDEQFRSAVEDLSQGKIVEGFEKLNDMGAIKTIDPLKPNVDLVNDYVHTVKQGKTALVISPTHAQGDQVTREIRDKLREACLIGKKEIITSRLFSLNFTEAEKMDWRNYNKDQAVQFEQNAPGILRGSLWMVKGVTEKEVLIQNDIGETLPLPLNKANRYQVYVQQDITLSKGDKLRITHNGFDAEGKRLNNGDLLEVVKVGKKGGVVLQNPISHNTYKLGHDFGHLAHAHCITSHASQGKTVDEVFISQPAATFGATDAKQFYVSISRARDQVRIYTDDKNELLRNAAELGDRQSAHELVDQIKTHEKFAIHAQRHMQNLGRGNLAQQTKEDYEP